MTVLATSRERIQVYGEQEYQVQPLHLPVLSTKESLEQLQKYDAIRLFVQRVGIIRTGFTLDKEQTNTVAQICVRLDGLPLAIESAGARTKLFTPQQMLERLDSRLSLLTVSMRDAPARQRTLRDTIDWSYNLLNKDEQRLFARLAVFIGGFSPRCN